MTPEEILTLINKAAITTATGGQLSTEQAKQFFDLTVKQSDLLQAVQTVLMTSDTYELNTIEIASRQMRGATEAVAPTDLISPTITPRTLSAKESILPYDIGFSWLETNIEGANAESKLNGMFATSFGNDLIDLAINGNETLAATITDADADGVDDTTGLVQNDHSFLRQNNGWIYTARNDSDVHSYEIPADLTTITWKEIFKNMLALLPVKWRTNPAELAFLVSPDVDDAYKYELSARATALGDAFLTENRRATAASGITVIPVPFFPAITNPAGPSVMLTKLKNLGVGVGRNMRVGRQVQERKRVIEYTITGKTDFNYVVSDMIVLGEMA